MNYIAPEVIKHAGYEGHKADIWSCGVMLYYMLAGCTFTYYHVDLPFDDESFPKLIDKIVLAQFEFPPTFSSEAKDLIANILTSNPNKRLSLERIKAHPWLKSAIPKAPRALEKAIPKDFNELTQDEYVPTKMDAFEFANCCTGKILNGLFEIKGTTTENEKESEVKTEIITNVGYKEYLGIVILKITVDISCNGKDECKDKDRFKERIYIR